MTTPSPLDGMTQAKWDSLRPIERERIRDNSGLHPQLVGLEGYRVQVVTQDGATLRFIVGKSTGWRPCHLEIARRTSHGGGPVDSRPFQSVKTLEKVR